MKKVAIYLSAAQGDPYWLNAKFKSKCHNCHDTINKGDKILYWPRTKQVMCDKEKCGKKEWQDFQSHAADEEVYHGHGNPYYR